MLYHLAQFIKLHPNSSVLIICFFPWLICKIFCLTSVSSKTIKLEYCSMPEQSWMSLGLNKWFNGD